MFPDWSISNKPLGLIVVVILVLPSAGYTDSLTNVELSGRAEVYADVMTLSLGPRIGWQTSQRNSSFSTKNRANITQSSDQPKDEVSWQSSNDVFLQSSQGTLSQRIQFNASENQSGSDEQRSIDNQRGSVTSAMSMQTGNRLQHSVAHVWQESRQTTSVDNEENSLTQSSNSVSGLSRFNWNSATEVSVNVAYTLKSENTEVASLGIGGLIRGNQRFLDLSLYTGGVKRKEQQSQQLGGSLKFSDQSSFSDIGLFIERRFTDTSSVFEVAELVLPAKAVNEVQIDRYGFTVSDLQWGSQVQANLGFERGRIETNQELLTDDELEIFPEETDQSYDRGSANLSWKLNRKSSLMAGMSFGTGQEDQWNLAYQFNSGINQKTRYRLGVNVSESNAMLYLNVNYRSR